MGEGGGVTKDSSGGRWEGPSRYDVCVAHGLQIQFGRGQIPRRPEEDVCIGGMSGIYIPEIYNILIKYSNIFFVRLRR